MLRALTVRLLGNRIRALTAQDASDRRLRAPRPQLHAPARLVVKEHAESVQTREGLVQARVRTIDAVHGLADRARGETLQHEQQRVAL